MAQGITQETVPYILKSDEGAPSEEVTIWWVKILTRLDTVDSTERFSRGVRMGSGGKTEIISGPYKRAIVEDWLQVVQKVENYHFGLKYPELQEQGWVPVIEERETIRKIFYDIPSDWADEITIVATGGIQPADINKFKKSKK